MRWPWDPGSGSEAGEPQPPASHHSLALKLLLDRLGPGARHEVLDLGPPIGHNLDLLSSLSCRVRIADLYRSLIVEPLPQREGRQYAALLPRLLPLRPDERFDAVLAWDLFDYLGPDQIARLAVHLGPACNPGALLFALVSIRSEIPPGPLRYRILDRETLGYEGPLRPPRQAPRRAPAALIRSLEGFGVVASFVVRSGVQEYLFAFGGGAKPRR